MDGKDDKWKGKRQKLKEEEKKKKIEVLYVIERLQKIERIKSLLCARYFIVNGGEDSRT